MIRKAEDTEVDNDEQSALKLWAQQPMSTTLVVNNQRPANETPFAGQLTLVKVPSVSNNAISFYFFFSLLFFPFTNFCDYMFLMHSTDVNALL